MGWSKYIVDDVNKIKYEISRNVHVEEFDEIVSEICRIHENYSRLYGKDLKFEQIDDYSKHILMDTGLTMHDVLVMSMDEYFYDFMFMIWLKNRDIDFRVVSEFELSDEDEPANGYKTIRMLNDI